LPFALSCFLPAISYFVGGRDSEYAMWFMDDVAKGTRKQHPPKEGELEGAALGI
jgi:hypothetical protein